MVYKKIEKTNFRIIGNFSGDEIIEMLKDVLSKDQLDLLTPKYKDALKNLVRKRILKEYFSKTITIKG